MNQAYDVEEYLMLSGIQHFFFCKRQWALIHIEQQWAENIRTTDGKHVHEKVDDPYIVETRGALIITRSMPVSSRNLGLFGIADVVEFRKNKRAGIPLKGKSGLWVPVPVEYKRGKKKNDERDEVQLCAQAICMEEMLNASIKEGYLYYHSERHRSIVSFDKALRKEVKALANEMHGLFRKRITPKAEYKKECKWCSLKEICQPKISSRKKNVKLYIKKGIEQL